MINGREGKDGEFRVLHIITRFLKWGGADLNTYYSIEALDREKYSVDLLVGRDSHMEALDRYDMGELFQINSLVRDPNPFLDPVALLRITQLVRNNGYHIVHTHTGKAGVLGRIAAKLAGVPLVIHGLHGSMESTNPILDKLYTGLDRFTASFTDKFVSVGEDLRNKYLDRGIGRPEDYTVIHSGMELESFRAAKDMDNKKLKEKKKELGIPLDAIVIGKVANFEPRKGYKYMVRAAGELNDQFEDLLFLFVGDGWYRDQVEEMVSGSGLEDRIIFTGFRRDIAEVMATFDVFAFTSLWEGLPQVLVQAAAEGLPIVTFDVEGAKEVVQNGRNGYVVPSKDVGALVKKIAELVENDEKRISMGSKGPKQIGDEWTVERMQNKTKELYNSLVEEAL